MAFPSTDILFQCAITEQPTSIWNTYFCKNDQILIADHALIEEHDGVYCGSCFASGTKKKEEEGYECARCWECPICFSALSVENSVKSSKVLFRCAYCQWSSLECAITGENYAALVTTCLKRITEVKKKNKPKLDEIVKKHQDRISKFPDPNQKSMGRKKTILGSSSQKAPPPQIKLFEEEKPEQTEQTVKLTNNVNLATIPLQSAPVSQIPDQNVNVNQQNAQKKPARVVSNLLPHRRILVAKRSKRCPVCEKLLIKPQTAGAPTVFRVDRSACFHLPSITIVEVPESKSIAINMTNYIDLLFLNPRDDAMIITFLPEKDNNLIKTNCQVTLPTKTLTIPAIEQKEQGKEETVNEVANAQVDEFYTKFSRNTVMIRLPFVPFDLQGPVVFGLSLRINSSSDTTTEEGAATQAQQPTTFEFPMWIQVGLFL
eukprot:c15970_g1_i1.p1 GENE.c15970_g1_i1~~c15970_g1_i1.p1  ORF type:complete len:431 (-),score=113.93 c15970_g1_i1:37-1329(-)